MPKRLGRACVAVLRLLGAPIAARPALSGGLAAGGLLFAFVSANAMYGQPGRHPHPLMATRGGVTGPAAAETNEAGLMPVPLVLEVQTALAGTGHYHATLDGKPGAATTAAIRSFQSERGLRVDGQPSPALLAAVRAVADPEREQHASLEDAAPDAGEQTGSVARLSDAELVRRIQSGLAAADVAKLTADGVAGAQTRAAIRTFEALEGLDVTGEPDERILKRLIEIGPRGESRRASAVCGERGNAPRRSISMRVTSDFFATSLVRRSSATAVSRRSSGVAPKPPVRSS